MSILFKGLYNSLIYKVEHIQRSTFFVLVFFVNKSKCFRETGGGVKDERGIRIYVYLVGKFSFSEMLSFESI